VGDPDSTAGSRLAKPLRLLEEKAGLRVAEVTEILRQQGDYKKAPRRSAKDRSKWHGRKLDKLGVIKQVQDR